MCPWHSVPKVIFSTSLDIPTVFHTEVFQDQTNKQTNKHSQIHCWYDKRKAPSRQKCRQKYHSKTIPNENYRGPDDLITCGNMGVTGELTTCSKAANLL